MSTLVPARVCVHWPRLGPYHLARLGALHERLAADGRELVALETATADLYDWRAETAPTPYRRVTLFPGATFEAVPARAMHRAVTAALDAIDPDAVAITSYSTPDARAALAWCRHRRRAAVMMFDSRAEDTDRAGWREALKRQIVRQFDAALVAGVPQAAYARALGIPPEAVFTPLDTVDNAYFAREAGLAAGGPSSRPGLQGDCPFFLTVARLLAVKNLPVLLRAYAAYRAAARDPWPLVVVGDGPLRTQLEAAAGPGVIFAGFQQVHALPAYYGRAGAFVLPSVKDTWGLVVNEAMAAGLPVLVSTGAGCAQDLVRDGVNGFTFAPADEARLADLLTRVAAMPAAERAALGAASQATIARYRPEDFAEQMCRAAEAGAARAGRGMTLGGRLVVGALRLAARSARSFQTISE